MYIYTCVQRVFSDLYNDQNAQTAHKAPECPTRRLNDQTTIYIPGGHYTRLQSLLTRRLSQNKVSCFPKNHEKSFIAMTIDI